MANHFKGQRLHAGTAQPNHVLLPKLPAGMAIQNVQSQDWLLIRVLNETQGRQLSIDEHWIGNDLHALGIFSFPPPVAARFLEAYQAWAVQIHGTNENPPGL